MVLRRIRLIRRRRRVLPPTAKGCCPVCGTEEPVLEVSDSSWGWGQLRESHVRLASIEGPRRGRQTDYFRELEEKIRAVLRRWFHRSKD